MSRYPFLLAPGTLGAVAIENRVVMAPMTRGRASADGSPSGLMADHFAQRATAGLVITDGTMPTPHGVGYPGTPGLWTDEHAVAWREVVRRVHVEGGRIALQLLHCGRISLTAFQPDGGPPVSSSQVPAATVRLLSPQGTREPAAEPRALELQEIRGVVAQFGQAARRARIAGFDAVEIHAANGYLVDQFLRDGVNQRHDRYGGSAENRARFLLETCEAVAKEMGADRTGVRLSPLDPSNDMRDGNPLDTFGTTLRHVAALGLAWTQLAMPGNADLTHRLRDAYARPFILDGKLTASSADEAIRSELACAVSFGTAFIANPDLVARFTHDHPLSDADPDTFFTGGERGYLDYPLHT